MRAYLVLDLTIHDLNDFSEYIQKIPALITRHGGRYLVQGEQPTPIEGDWRPERMVILEFPDNEQAQGFLQDPQAQALFKIRHRAATSKLVLVDGCLE